MSRAEIIEKTIIALNSLPENKGEEVVNFADFLVKKNDEQQLQKGIHYMMRRCSK